MNAKDFPASYLNRDHVTLVTVDQMEVIVTTIMGRRIVFSAPPSTLAEFADELANNIASNFVTIPSANVSIG
jgi:hypothetical protein